MSHLLIKVTDFEIVGSYTLRVWFSDGVCETIYFKPVLQGHYYNPLLDQNLFNQVQLDPEIHTLVWPNGADFDPATLYNWNRGEGGELAQRVNEWQTVESA